MSKKTLNIVLVALLLVNIATLTLLWMKPGKGHEKPKGERLVHKLSFDETQKESFFVLREGHGQAVQDLEHSNHEIRKQYSSLMESNDLVTLDSLTNLVGANVAQIESLNFRHFQDIRKLCRDDQIEKFDRMMEHMSNGRKGPPSPGGPPPRGSQH